MGCHSLLRGNLPKPGFPALQAGSLLSEPPGKTMALVSAEAKSEVFCPGLSSFSCFVNWNNQKGSHANLLTSTEKI